MPGIHQGASSSPSARTARRHRRRHSSACLPSSLAGRGTGLACSHRLMRASARASGGPPSSFLRVDFLLSQSPLPSLSGLIHQKSLSRLDPGRGGRAGHGHERRSKNEMRLKKQGAPAPLARPPRSRRRGMGVLMSTYLSPRSFEQNTSVAWHKP